MDVGEIRKLVRLMEEAGLTELEIEDRSGKVRLVRGGLGASGARSGAASRGGSFEGGAAGGSNDVDAGARGFGELDESGDVGMPGGGAGASGGSGAFGGSGAESGEAPDRIPAGMTTITSPMVGTFYRAPAPDAPAFVNPGDVVQPGQVVCIIEAMKMMNEVTAETAARIVSVSVENGTVVEYGSALFLIELLE
jgi:biotin carboxyl carrier protein